jgi:hypothetical protein
MFSASVTIATFILMFLPVFGLDFLERRRRIAMLRLVAGIGLANAAYCVAAGNRLAGGWEPLLAAADPAELRAIVAHGHDNAAFAARAIRYWAYGLTVIGGFWTVVYGTAQWRAKRTCEGGLTAGLL